MVREQILNTLRKHGRVMVRMHGKDDMLYVEANRKDITSQFEHGFRKGAETGFKAEWENDNDLGKVIWIGAED